jgi:hypothetical protein
VWRMRVAVGVEEWVRVRVQEFVLRCRKHCDRH